MRIKLIEAQTVASLERNLQNIIFPKLADRLKLYFDVDTGLNKTSYDKVYKGYFDDDKVRVPVDLEVNTTHRQIDEWNDPDNHDGKFIKADCFMTMIIRGNKYEIGAVNSSKPNMVVEAIWDVIVDEKITFVLDIDTTNARVPALDGSEAHTEKEWKELFKQKQKELDSDDFGKWWNEVYPF